MKIKQLLEKYEGLEKEILSYFGYEENWHVYPIEDDTDYWWSIFDQQVWFSKEKKNQKKLIKAGYEYDGIMDCYSSVMISKEMIKEDCMAVLLDTQTDGNSFFAIFNNAKRLYAKE